MNIRELADRACRDLGFTVSFKDGTTPAHGYAVSIAGYERIVASMHAVELGQYLVDLLPLWEDLQGAEGGDSLHFGAWYDGKQWYLDVSTVIHTRSYAEALGRRNHQKAIFDLAKKESIAL